MGSRNNDGYGRFRSNGKLVRAHAFAYEWYHAQYIAKDIYVLHTCDTPWCVNPKHLTLGTQTDNMADMRLKGRYPKKRFCPQGHDTDKTGRNKQRGCVLCQREANRKYREKNPNWWRKYYAIHS
jgi:hypothetical protein